MFKSWSYKQIRTMVVYIILPDITQARVVQTCLYDRGTNFHWEESCIWSYLLIISWSTSYRVFCIILLFTKDRINVTLNGILCLRFWYTDLEKMRLFLRPLWFAIANTGIMYINRPNMQSFFVSYVLAYIWLIRHFCVTCDIIDSI